MEIEKIEPLNLKRQYNGIKNGIRDAVNDVLEEQRFILGPRVQYFENLMAEYIGTKYAVGVSSGSDALLMSLMAEGIGPGDEVITTPFTFFATAGCISRVGATPVFVDIEPHTYNIDPYSIEEKITDKTKAIIPVHLYGQCASMSIILDIAKRNNLVVIEDAAQAIGAEYTYRSRTVKKAGSMGHYGCLSFFPSKNLGAYGDAGMVVVDNPEKDKVLRMLRAHGSSPKYFHSTIGGNFRMDVLQAAILTVKLSYIDNWTVKRQKNAHMYNKLLKELESERHIKLPDVSENSTHVFHQYVISVDRRNDLQKHLYEQNICTMIYYPHPLHLQKCYEYLEYKKGSLPVSEKASESVLALPIYPELTTAEQIYIVGKIKEFFDGPK